MFNQLLINAIIAGSIKGHEIDYAVIEKELKKLSNESGKHIRGRQ